MIRQCERRLHRHIARLDEIIHELWNPDSMSDGYGPLIELNELRDELGNLERDIAHTNIKEELRNDE